MSKLYTYNVDVSLYTTEDNIDTFLTSLKLHIPSFASFYANKVWFTLSNIELDYINFVNNYIPLSAEEEIRNVFPKEPEMMIMKSDPVIDINPVQKGVIWINEITGRMFTCINNEINKNIWSSTDGLLMIRPVPEADRFDFYQDGSATAFYLFNNNSLDVGGKYHGVEDDIKWSEGLEGEAADSKSDGQIKIHNLPFDSSTQSITIGSWVRWDGGTSCMPYGFKSYDLFVNRGKIGFNTGAGDVTGFDMNPYEEEWVYMVTIFRKGAPGEIYIDGILQSGTNYSGTFNISNAVMDSTLNIFGWGVSSGYRKFGRVERLRIFNRALTSVEVGLISQAEKIFIDSINGGK